MDVYEKSFQILKKLAKAQKQFNFKFYLIGGWAVWAYNPYMKSRDIDIIVMPQDLWKLESALRRLGFRETTGTRLAKKGFALLWNSDKIEVDVYSDKIGKWRAVELIKGAVKKAINHEPVLVLSPTNLFLLKAFVALERLGTEKGEKDLSDILALLSSGQMLDLKKINRMVNLKALREILLKDFKLASRIYPMELREYKKIKKLFDEALR